MSQFFTSGGQSIGVSASVHEIWVQSLGWEDPPEKGKATHSSILALGSPIFPWSCEGKLGVLLESLQGQRDLTTAHGLLAGVASHCGARALGHRGQNTGVGSLSLLQGIFPSQGSNPGLPHCRKILYHFV